MRKSRFYVCVRAHGVVLWENLHNASKKQAEGRVLNVEEAAEKGREWTECSSYILADDFVPYYPIELILIVHKSQPAAITCVPLTNLAQECTCTILSCDDGCAHQHSHSESLLPAFNPQTEVN